MKAPAFHGAQVPRPQRHEGLRGIAEGVIVEGQTREVFGGDAAGPLVRFYRGS